MQVADRTNAFRRGQYLRALPASEEPPALLVGSYCKLFGRLPKGAASAEKDGGGSVAHWTAPLIPKHAAIGKAPERGRAIKSAANLPFCNPSPGAVFPIEEEKRRCKGCGRIYGKLKNARQTEKRKKQKRLDKFWRLDYDAEKLCR